MARCARGETRDWVRPTIERMPGPTPVAGINNLVRVWSRADGNLGRTRDGHILAWGSVYVAR